MKKPPPLTGQEQLVNRLKRLQGQVSGVERMVDDDRYCVDILVQVSAIRAAVDQLGVVLLTYHLKECVEGAGCRCGLGGNQEEAQELMIALKSFLGVEMAASVVKDPPEH